MQLVRPVPAAHPTLFHRNGFGVKGVRDSEALWIAVDAEWGRGGEVGDDDVSLCGRQSTGPVEQHVVVTHQVGGGAHGVPPVAVVRRGGGGQLVAGHDPFDDLVAPPLHPEVVGLKVIGGPQHDLESAPVLAVELSVAPRQPHEQIVGDEQLGHRGDGKGSGVAPGDHPAGAAVQDGEGDVGPVARGVGGGFAGSDVKIGGRIGQWRGRRRLGCRCRSGGQQGDLLGRAGPVGLESDGGCAQQQRCSQDRHRGKDHRTPASHGPLLSSS